MSTNFPIVTKSLWFQAAEPELLKKIAEEIEAFKLANKTDGQPIIRSDGIVYRFWADVESAQTWVDYWNNQSIPGLSTFSIITDQAEIDSI